MVLTNDAKDEILGTVKDLFTTGGIGLDSTAEVSSDDGLFGGGTTVDACDSSSIAWSTLSGDAQSAALNTSAGYYQEGTGCYNIPFTYSSGTGSWARTISTTNLSGKKLAIWFYILSADDLASSSDAITITLGTGGFVNYNDYYFNYENFSSGWTSLVLDTSSISDSGGTGADLTDVDNIKITTKVDSTQSGTEMRMDYWRYYEPDTLGITDSQNSLTVATGTNYFKTTHIINVLESNGLDIVESGDTDGSTLLPRQTFAAVSKGNSTELQIDKFYYID